MISKRTAFLIGVSAMLAACSGAPDDLPNIGYVEADWVYISSPQSGWLISRAVREGDKITAGQVLFELDKDRQEAALKEIDGRIAQAGADAKNTETGARPAEIRGLQAHLLEAEARLSQARSEQARILPLVERGVEPRNRGEQVTANVQIAKAAVEAAKETINVAQLAARPAVREAAQAGVITAEAQRLSAEIGLKERTIRAQTSGRIEEIFHQPGEFLSAGSPVLAILPEDGMKVKFFVPQADLPQLSLGKTVRVKADGLTTAIDADVSYIATNAEFTPPVIYSRGSREKLVFLVEATLPANSAFRPGLPVEIEWD